MPFSISTLLIRNLHGVFGENDPARRRAAIDEIWTEVHGRHRTVPPPGGLSGHHSKSAEGVGRTLWWRERCHESVDRIAGVTARSVRDTRRFGHRAG